ncbi:inositol monophosphatase family protein [Candidatus Pelagibacter sp. HIMB1521]|uniref:inositol monophosphatase family protein n=1 Tax=unclassified Candidatus Pelagibacter TaxID=2647897 RepID=UPI003F870E6F
MNSNKTHEIYPEFLNQLAVDLNIFYKKIINSNINVKNKNKSGKFNPVTSFDKAFEKFIRNKINKRFPGHSIVGEEFKTKNKKSDYSWIIDPIDGTKSFVVGNPTWSNLISLNYKGNPQFGLANFPELNKYYFNQSANTAYVVKNGKKRKLRANKKSTFNQMKLAGEFHGWLSLDQQLKILKVLDLMQFPSSDALSYVNFCEGKIDSVIQCVNKIWDIHALIPIIKASGGIASTWSNKDPKEAGTILVSSNKIIHNKMLGYLKPLSEFIPGGINN